jgi:thiamine biosynthesis lipoprotein
MSTNSKPITRRRCLTILSAALIPPSALLSKSAQSKPVQHITWHGILMGANASITLATENETHAKTTLTKLLEEVKKLESYFSLYQKNSLINQLNIKGSLKNPPTEFKELIKQSQHFAKLTNGAFDPTIQPLFMAYKNLGSTLPKNDLANHPAVKQARDLINWQAIKCEANKISFEKHGMAITLNGIAQGFITDKAVEILKENGFENTLVNFGEYHGLGSKTPNSNEGWMIQLGQQNTNNQAPDLWPLKNNALAASSQNGYKFENVPSLHHMLDPKSGTNQTAWQEIYVLAKSATTADAASTALFASTPECVSKIAKTLKIQKALLIKTDGSKVYL